jgi:uncharacterized protein
VPKDYAEAAKWYRLAADQGNPEAQIALGVMKANGQGMSKSEEETARLFRLAADQGRATAQVNLGIMTVNGQGIHRTTLRLQSGFALAQTRATLTRSSVWA